MRRVRLEAKRLLTLQRRRHDHAGGGAAVREQLFDEVLEVGHGGEDDLEEEGVVAGEVVALLHGVERGEELEEGFVTVPSQVRRTKAVMVRPRAWRLISAR